MRPNPRDQTAEVVRQEISPPSLKQWGKASLIELIRGLRIINILGILQNDSRKITNAGELTVVVSVKLRYECKIQAAGNKIKLVASIWIQLLFPFVMHVLMSISCELPTLEKWCANNSKSTSIHQLFDTQCVRIWSLLIDYHPKDLQHPFITFYFSVHVMRRATTKNPIYNLT